MKGFLQWVRHALRVGNERRRHPRQVAPPMPLIIDGRRCDAADWSLGGFRLNEPSEPLLVGARLKLRNEGRAGPDAGVIVAEVVWLRDGQLGLKTLSVDGVEVSDHLP